MRLVIDLQALQSKGSRDRGIGRYSRDLVRGMLRQRGEHDVSLAMNGLHEATVHELRGEFSEFLPQENMHCWESLSDVYAANPANSERRQAMEQVRESFIASLRPDAVLVTSLFEGLGDDIVTSVRCGSLQVPTAVMLHDLMPMIHERTYLAERRSAEWYRGKLAHLARADLLLCISESARAEALSLVEVAAENVVNISSSVDAQFRQLSRTDTVGSDHVIRRLDLPGRFLMSIGGGAPHENVEVLVTAYAGIPDRLRHGCCLLIVGKADDAFRQRIGRLGKQVGLREDELILSGHVSDGELVTLYNACELLVLPSWQEGFNQPALEAMACACPVIASNTSSLAEVVGRRDAFFDPHDPAAIRQKIIDVLNDDAFRAALATHGLQQTQRLSWDATAERAWRALEACLAAHPTSRPHRSTANASRLPKLAFVSPLPPERSGISDYSAQLLPALAKHYEIDVILSQEAVSDAWTRDHLPVRSTSWFMQQHHRFDRVLYQMGNSLFHSYMFELMKRIPGVIVLHDFYLSHAISSLDYGGIRPGYWSDQLEHSHGWSAVSEHNRRDGLADVLMRYPCNLGVIQSALGVIVHSEHACALARQWYGHRAADDWHIVPMVRPQPVSPDRIAARTALGIDADELVVCAFGTLGETKENSRLVTAWQQSRTSCRASNRLVFVGGDADSNYAETLQRSARTGNARVQFTHWVDPEAYHHWLAATDLAVQLGKQSRGQTSAALMDCMNHGLPVITVSHGAATEVTSNAVVHLPSMYSDSQLASLIDELAGDTGRRRQLGERARRLVAEHHRPVQCASRYRNIVEEIYSERAAWHPINTAEAAIAAWPKIPRTDQGRLARILADNHPPRPRQRQLLLDVSELVHRDAKTGIQRVVRNLVNTLLKGTTRWQVRPVYADGPGVYRYASRFTHAMTGGDTRRTRHDDVVQAYFGDVFLGLDFILHHATTQREYFRQLRKRGILIYFVVYDLLPLYIPDAFLNPIADHFPEWLQMIADSDGALCISAAVCEEFSTWLQQQRPERHGRMKVESFTLGADFVRTAETDRGPPTSAYNLATPPRVLDFLMVGTVEPRKGHAQVLDAFERLWGEGFEARLTIVGKQGWMVESLARRIRTHPEFERRLIWPEKVDDDALAALYRSSDCLIAASIGEGFGLPLIEAAQYGVPIIARDLPIFREVAGQHAHYFSGTAPEPLAQAIREWVTLRLSNEHPRSSGVHWITWHESTQELMRAAGLLDHTSTVRSQLSEDNQAQPQQNLANTGILRTNHSTNTTFTHHRRLHAQLIYIHCEKTAGTSQWACFKKNYGQSQVFRREDNVQIANIRHLHEINCMVVGGHLTYDQFRDFNRLLLFTSVVREPISRAVSLYHFFCENAAEENKLRWIRRGIDSNSMLNTIETVPEFRRQITNMQCFRLSGNRNFEFTRNLLSTENFLVGDFNHLQMFNARLGDILGWQHTTLGEHNVAKTPGYQNAILAEPKLRKLIIELNKEDLKLHDFVSTRVVHEHLPDELFFREHLSTRPPASGVSASCVIDDTDDAQTQ